MKVELLPERDKHGLNQYRLIEDYSYVVGGLTTVTVPEGFVTNFGTIPRGLRWIVRPAEMREASVVHDYLCGEGTGEEKSTRWIADCILLEDLNKQGMSRLRRYCVFVGLRAYALWKGKN